MDSSYSLTEHVRPEDGVGLPCTDKTPCRPCYGVLKPIAAPPRGITESSLPAFRPGRGFFPSPSCSPPQGGVQAVNLVLFRSTNNDINYLYHLRIQ